MQRTTNRHASVRNSVEIVNHCDGVFTLDTAAVGLLQPGPVYVLGRADLGPMDANKARAMIKKINSAISGDRKVK